MILAKTVDAAGEKHDAIYLKRITYEMTCGVQNCFECKVGAIVTDSAPAMAKMRAELANDEELNLDIIMYGCAAHVANLLAHDLAKILNSETTQSRVMHVVKYFRNHHLPKSWFKDAGGTMMTMPIDVRWNSYCDTFKTYLKNWPVMLEICEKYRNEINRDVKLYVQSLSLKRNVEDIFHMFNPISVALDRLQQSTCQIAECVAVWKQLERDLSANSNFTTPYKNCFQDRYEMVLQPCHFAAYMLSPRYIEISQSLPENEAKKGMTYIEEEFPVSFLSKYFKFKALSYHLFPVQL